MRRIVLILLVFVTFAATAPRGADWARDETAPLTPEEQEEQARAVALAKDLVAYTEEKGINYIIDPEYPGRWAVRFVGENYNWTITVTISTKYTVFVMELINIPPDVSPDFYKWLLDANFQMNQAKFGTEGDRLFFNVDIPTRVLDRIEYFETINSMAGYIDGVYPEIVDKANAANNK